MKRKVALIWLGHKLEKEKRETGVNREKNGVRVGGNQKDPQGSLLRALSRVNHCGLFNFPTERNND